MADLRTVYARKAISQIPRLLTLLDRNQLSPTYGCFHRDYWLYKTSDFPDAVRQFGVHALALVYRHDLPGNVYRGHEKIRKWTIAGLDFWARLQHRDGSFDEFYPYERGWVGPTAFTTYTAIESLKLLEDDIPADVRDRVVSSIRRAASFIAAGQSEEDHLANHHAMACLAVWKAFEMLEDPELERGFERLWQVFLTYHDTGEGWSREYDGTDPGYLSATVSFLAKIYQTYRHPEMATVLQQSIDFCSYFAYPNGFYAGSVGSRNTLHFYPHGFEIMAPELPLAAAVADKMLHGLSEDKLVAPEIMSDRYVFYRVPELLLSYLDCPPRPAELAPLPWEREIFRRSFERARIYVANEPGHYVVANLAKGGVIKVFDKKSGRLELNDCGLIGRLDDGRVVTTQWVDPDYESTVDEDGFLVRGLLHSVPSNKVFTPLKHMVFRGVLLLLGWNPRLAHILKGRIRHMLILNQKPVPVRFCRRLRLGERDISLCDELKLDGRVTFERLTVGDEFAVRYVPQSRFFQSQELNVEGTDIDETSLKELHEEGVLTIETQLHEGRRTVTVR